MAKVFISYRRDDSAGHAGRLFDRLKQHLDDDRIVMDLETINRAQVDAGGPSAARKPSFNRLSSTRCASIGRPPTRQRS
jgi:hypothetical protein